MSRLVVIGGGFGGLAAAARLAKLGHSVTLIEQGPTLGGALRPVTAEGYRWDASASYTLLPAVIRDLFRKSGRPAEREITLVDQPIIREHRFHDDSRVQVPGGSRAAQLAAFGELGAGLGQQWVDYVASWADDWELLRKHYFEHPWCPEIAPREVNRLLRSRTTVDKRIRAAFKDERLRQVAAHPIEFAGHNPRNVPAWMGTVAYLEQTFGAWRIPSADGGMAALTQALARRLSTRGVSVLTNTAALDLVVTNNRVRAVSTTGGEVAADVVVTAIDPRKLPALARHVERTMPAIPPVIAYLGLTHEAPALPAETVFHGNPKTDPTIVVRTGGVGPEGAPAWTLSARGKVAEDLVTVLVRRGLDVREHVRIKVERSPRELVEDWGGSPEGVLWQGRATVSQRLGPATPIAGVYAAGAHATPGSGLHLVGLSAALVAEAIGPA